MFIVEREETKVVFRVDIPIPKYEERRFRFDFECSSEVYAGMLADRIENEIENRIVNARREEYEKGYKDGKNHQKKETWFECAI